MAFEEILPKADVSRLDPDQLIEDVAHLAIGHLAQRLIEQQVKDLIQDQRLSELRVVCLRCSHGEQPIYSCVAEMNTLIVPVARARDHPAIASRLFFSLLSVGSDDQPKPTASLHPRA